MCDLAINHFTPGRQQASAERNASLAAVLSKSIYPEQTGWNDTSQKDTYTEKCTVLHAADLTAIATIYVAQGEYLRGDFQ
jgi:hypothetical protein